MPTSVPYSANRRWPSASISATRSLARVPVSYPPWGLPDRPIPRWSTATTEKSRASAGISMRQAYQVCGQPCTSSSGGPLPPVTACRRSPPVSTYRLVNVSVNPGGRFGAPETEPGPSGVVAADELMSIPFSRGPCGLSRPNARQAIHPETPVAADGSDPTPADTRWALADQGSAKGQTHHQHLSGRCCWQQVGAPKGAHPHVRSVITFVPDPGSSGISAL